MFEVGGTEPQQGKVIGQQGFGFLPAQMVDF
jgi:hypothetical protein